MPDKEEIYKFLKKNKGIKFRVIHLADLFEIERTAMGDKLRSMYKNNETIYKNLNRESVTRTAENSRAFLCFVYFVK